MIRQDSPPVPLHCPVQPSGVNFQIVLRTAAYPPHGHEDISAPFRNKTPNDSPYQPHLSARTSAMARHRRQARKRLRMEASCRRSSIGKAVPRRMLSVDLAGRTKARRTGPTGPNPARGAYGGGEDASRPRGSVFLSRFLYVAVSSAVYVDLLVPSLEQYIFSAPFGHQLGQPLDEFGLGEAELAHDVVPHGP